MKTVRIILWAMVLLTLVGVVVRKVIWSKPAPPQEKALFAAGEISLTDQDGKAFSTGQLRGHPWVADFIFASCPSSCPMMSHRMDELQKKTPAGVHLVSFTVDPEHDTPVILKEYGQVYHADFSRWHFLTGTKQQMGEAAYAMKISVQPASKDAAIIHSEKFLLVNAAGNVVGIYDGTNAQDVDRLATDAARLIASGGGGKSS